MVLIDEHLKLIVFKLLSSSSIVKAFNFSSIEILSPSILNAKNDLYILNH